MAYRILADVVMLLHFAFIVYVVTGGFLAWLWPRTIIPHLFAAGWGLVLIAFALTCPLTPLENWFRRLGGEDQLVPGGFIDHYIEGVIYPARHAGTLRALAALAVLVSWVGLCLIWRHRRAALRSGVESADRN